MIFQKNELNEQIMITHYWGKYKLLLWEQILCNKIEI